jgi:hypothetical protein
MPHRRRVQNLQHARGKQAICAKNPPVTKGVVPGGFEVRIPAITDFRAKGTIMGLAGLTAVFGMGTGVTPPVWSPEMYPAGGQARPGTGFPMVGRTATHKP